MKRILITILSLVVLLCSVFAVACKNEGNDDGQNPPFKDEQATTPTEGLDYSLINNQAEYEVTGIGSATVANVVIPDEYNGKPVTAIGEEAFSYWWGITSITMGENITTIGDAAFMGCHNLASVKMGENVKSIGRYAFSNMDSLVSIEISDSVTDIEYAAFFKCENLESISTGQGIKNIGDYAFEKSMNLKKVTVGDDVENIGERAFYECPIEEAIMPVQVINHLSKPILKHVTITKGEIYDNALSRSPLLTTLTLSKDINIIGKNAFTSCPKLERISVDPLNENFKSIDGDLYNKKTNSLVQYSLGKVDEEFTIPEGVYSLSEFALYDATYLKNVFIGKDIVTIGEKALGSCLKLENIIVDQQNDNFKSIDGNLYNKKTNSLVQYSTGKEDTSFTIPEGTLDISDFAFFDATYLTNVIVAESVLTAGDKAFYQNSIRSLSTSPIIANAVYESGIQNLTITNSKSIQENAFVNCSVIKNLTISEFVEEIKVSAFKDCSQLNTLTIVKSEKDGVVSGVNEIGANAFSGCPIETVNIPTSAISHIPQNSLKTVSITFGDEIEDNAFENCNSLMSVTLGQTLKTIGDSAFAGCLRLNTLTIVKSEKDGVVSGVNEIGANAFSGCPIETVNIPTSAISHIPQNSLKTVSITFGDEIEDNAFENCETLTEIELGATVRVIGVSAFAGCKSLKSLTISKTVNSIKESAFAGCSALKTLTVVKTIEAGVETGVGEIGTNAFNGCPIETANIPISMISYLSLNSLTSLSITFGDEIGESAFSNNQTLSSIDIGDTVTKIGISAFENCQNLTKVVISKTISLIGEKAFANCEKLTNIEYKGTIAQWNAIGYEELPINLEKIKCSDGEIILKAQQD